MGSLSVKLSVVSEKREAKMYKYLEWGGHAYESFRM